MVCPSSVKADTLSHPHVDGLTPRPLPVGVAGGHAEPIFHSALQSVSIRGKKFFHLSSRGNSLDSLMSCVLHSTPWN